MKHFLALGLRVVAICCAVGLSSLESHADLNATLTPSADTTLFAFLPDNNLGANVNFIVGTTATGSKNRAIVKFNLASIPANATITSALLTINVVKAGAGPGSVFEVHRVLRDWGEGVGTGGQGSPANAGEATWNNRFHPSTPWSPAGGGADVDYASAVSATASVDLSGNYGFGSSAGLIADVQMWLANSGTNFGWMLISESEGTNATARRVASREDALNGPKLFLQYTVPAAPTPPTLTVLAPANGNFRFGFNTESNHGYLVEYKGVVTGTNWNTLVVLDPAPVSSSAVISDPFTTSNRLYRVRKN